MDVDDEIETLEEELLYILLVRRRRRRNKRRKARFWVRDIFLNRKRYGEYHNLVQ